MKILLINPNAAQQDGRDPFTGSVFTSLVKCAPALNGCTTFPLALTTLAAVTPREHSVKIIDEVLDPVDFDEDCDLVGLTAMTFKIDRAIEISREFQQRGKTVVLGGIHATVCPEKVTGHFNSIVQGEAEEIWPQVLQDFQNHSLKKSYVAPRPPDITKIPPPRYELIDLGRYCLICLQTSRGCPYNCEFCSVTRVNGRTMRFKSPAQVVAEIDHAIKSVPYPPLMVRDKADNKIKRHFTNFFFTDDNFSIDRQHAVDVCNAMIRYQEENQCIFSWMTQVNFRTGLDQELLALFAKSGCGTLLLGFESLDPDNLKALNKNMNAPGLYAQAVKNMQAFSIDCIAALIIGNEFDTPKTSDLIMDFIQRTRICFCSLSILTPFPGTRLHQKMREEKTIFSEDYSKYNFRNIVFRPKRMTPGELQQLYADLVHRIYGIDGMLPRGRMLADNAHKTSTIVLTWPARIVSCFLLTYALIGLGFYKNVSFRSIFRVLPELMFNILAHGTTSDFSYMGWVLDNDDFARSEAKRIRRMNKT